MIWVRFRPSWRAATQRARRLRRRNGTASRRAWPRSKLAEAAAAAERLAAELTGKVERLQATLDAGENQQRALQRLAQAIRQRDDGRAALRAVASEVRLELEPQAWGRVRVDGRALDGTSRWLRIVEPLDIEIADVGRIQVRPVVEDHRRLQASVKDAERRIARELEVLGLRPPNPKARQLEFELAADVPLAGAAPGLRPEGTEPPCWPEAAAVDTALAEVERQIDGLAAQLRPARRELDQATAARHETRAAHGQAVDRCAQAKQRLEQLRAELSEVERATAGGRSRGPQRGAARGGRARRGPPAPAARAGARRNRSKRSSSALPGSGRRWTTAPPRCASAS